MGKSFWSRFCLLLYVPLLFVLVLLIFVTSFYEVVPLFFVLVTYIVLNMWVSDSRFLVLINTYLFIGVLSNEVLLRYKLLRTEYYFPVLFLYILFVLFSGIIWSLSVSSITGFLRIRYWSCENILRYLWVSGLLVGLVLFIYSTMPFQLELFMVILVLLPGLVMVLLLLLFERSIFHRVLLFAKSEKGHEPDRLIYTFFVSLFVFAVIVFTVLFPELRPGDRMYLALSIAFTYYYSSLFLGLLADLFIVHGRILDHMRITDHEYRYYLEEALSDYFRMRYVSSLVRIFNYLEALGGRGRGYMSQRLGEVLLDSYRRWSSVLKGIDVFKHIDEFIDEINSTSIIRLRSDLYRFLEIVDETGGSAKSIESLALKLYREIISGGNVSKTLKQFRGEVKALLRKCKSMNNVDCSMLEELYNNLKNSERINSFINDIVEKKPIKLRDLRNFLVHGKLTRVYVLVENNILDYPSFINESIKLYMITTLLLLSINDQLR